MRMDLMKRLSEMEIEEKNITAQLKKNLENEKRKVVLIRCVSIPLC
jgi:hypothetical protein